MARSWIHILSLWLIGVLAAAQLAKFAVMAPVVREGYGLTLAEAGLLISLLEIGGALFGFVAGLYTGWLGARRLLVAGLALLAGTGAMESLAQSVTMLFAARAVEGIGYLLVVVSAPTLIMVVATARSRSAALALWSTFVPAGMALGSAVTGATIGTLGFGGTSALWSATCLVALIVSRQLPSTPKSTRGSAAMPKAGAWFATLGFGCFTMFVSALTALLPTFLVDATGASLGRASLATGLASIAALPGAAVAIGIFRGADTGLRWPVAALVSVMLATVALAPATFAVTSGHAFRATTIFAVLLVALSAVASSIVFARLPALAGARSEVDSRIAAANGLVTQFGAAGALVGPPLGAVVVDTWGWAALGVAIAVLAATMLCLVLLAETVARNMFSVPAPGTLAPETTKR